MTHGVAVDREHPLAVVAEADPEVLRVVGELAHHLGAVGVEAEVTAVDAVTRFARDGVVLLERRDSIMPRCRIPSFRIATRPWLTGATARGRPSAHVEYYEALALLEFEAIIARLGLQRKHYEVLPPDHDMDVDNLASATLARQLDELGVPDRARYRRPHRRTREDSMRFTYAESMCDPHQLIPLAQAAEDAGYTSFTVPDSICFPRESSTLYPYNPDGNREFLEGKPFIDPFALMAALGATTTTLRFATFVIKLPIRSPVLVAKQATSVAYLTRNRVTLGVGLSPWPEDYTVTGTEWRRRGKRLDEMIEILRGLSTGEFFEYHGEFYDIPAIKLCPVPDSLPILLGGHADAALRRAARLCDGWMHGGGRDDLDALLSKLDQCRREEGRRNEPFEIHVISMDAYTPDGVKRLEDKGVTDCIVGFRNAYDTDTQTLQHKLDALRGFADRVITKIG